jgi:hypothetical protein
MSVQLFRELQELIDTTEHIVVAVIVAEGCENYKGKFLTDFENQIRNQSNPVSLHVICYREEPIMFPRPLTQAVYYFAPKNYTPLFYRQGSRAIGTAADIAIALKMVQGMSYTEAVYGEDVAKKESYERMEHLVKTEDTSTFPSIFQQARNFAKEMWHVGKNAAAGLPILVDADTAFQRFETCRGCEFLKQDSFRCEKCGCFMKTKTQLASASCPIEKWRAVTV